VAPSPSHGTIKSQWQLDGKFGADAHPHMPGISGVRRDKNINADNPLLLCMGLFSIFWVLAAPEFG
jgi:hypothetical protein